MYTPDEYIKYKWISPHC